MWSGRWAALKRVNRCDDHLLLAHPHSPILPLLRMRPSRRQHSHTLFISTSFPKVSLHLGSFIGPSLAKYSVVREPEPGQIVVDHAASRNVASNCPDILLPSAYHLAKPLLYVPDQKSALFSAHHIVCLLVMIQTWHFV